MQVITLFLTNRVISKKNSRQNIVRGGRRFNVPSNAFQRFQNDAILELNDQLMGDAALRSIMPITAPIHIATTFHIKGLYKVDADNLHTSILDVLQAARIIFDDSQVIEGNYTKISGCKEWVTVIRITVE